LHGKFLIEKGDNKKGFQLIEIGYHKFTTQKQHINASYIKEKINSLGYRTYQKIIFDFIDILPLVANKSLSEWSNQAKSNGLNFSFKASRGNVLIEQLFRDKDDKKNKLSYINTIHSVKGQTLEAILVFLGKKDRSNYVTLINSEFDTLSSENKEQMRIVYVACSRPRKLLWLAVPNDDVEIWRNYLKI
jgi:superfamily I DNA/RNA helicase